MDHILDTLGKLVLAYPAWSHLILAAGILLQGEITILLSMYLIASGDLSWHGYLFSTFPALVIGESFLYFFGRSLRHTRFGWHLYYKFKTNRKLQFYFYYTKKNLTKLVVASKFLLGTNLILMLLIGWIKTNYRTFMKSYLIGAFFWFTTISVVAYSLMSGVHELKSARVLHQTELAFAGAFVLMFLGEYILRKTIKKKMFGGDIKADDLKAVVEEELSKEEKTKNPTA